MNADQNSRQPMQSERSSEGLSRRQFLAGLGGLGIGAILGGGIAAIALPDEVYAIEASEGYLLVDTKKCAGCQSCMLTCSLVHSGSENLALSRIQVNKNPLREFPYDIAQHQCRQCPYPSCVEACPVGAMHVDPETHARVVDEGKCIGCERCVSACPFTPSRVQWNFEERHAQKCDLCKNTPYWSREGGPRGDQACVLICPMQAITFTNELPVQTDEGYTANLRNVHYARMAFPVDDEGEVPPRAYLSSVNDPTVAAPASTQSKEE